MKAADIESIFVSLGYTFNRSQFGLIFSALDESQPQVYNYKQLLEIVLGHDDAQKFFAGAALGGGKFGGAIAMGSQVKFVMPREPIGAKSNILADIGRKFIKSGLNYEDMLKKLIGEAQAYALSPKGTEAHIL